MIELGLRELYRGLISNFEFEGVAGEMLGRITAGSDKADDYEEILKKDKFFTSTICRLASANMKASVVSSLGHGVVLVGQERVRNMVMGHSLCRAFDPYADNNFQGLQDAEKSVHYAIKAEEHARKCGNEYTGLAYASGYIFDYFAKWISREEQHIKDMMEPFLDSIWRHSMKTAALAWGLCTHERVLISHRKIIFSSGIIHDIGKLGLGLYEPKEYSKCIERFKFDQELNITDHGYEAIIEREHFDLSHCEIGSAIVFQMKSLRDVETEVDFHHDSLLLKTRHSDAFLGAAILNIADRLAWLMDRKPSFEIEDLQEILKYHAEYFPLKSPDVMKIATEFRAKGLLTG